MKKRWIYPPEPSAEKISELSGSINVSPALASILLKRGIFNLESAKNFFRPDLSMLHDPFLMKDMDKAVDRLKQAIDLRQRILVFGDYDVDGTTSVALVYGYLQSLEADCLYYIPDRNKEGYGVSEAGIDWAIQQKVNLIITVDLGIKSSGMVEKASRAGIDFIICDHHLPDEHIPSARAVLDPKQSDCLYPYKELSGCGIGFKLLQGFAQKYGQEQQLFSYLDLVAVSISSDIVPLTGENRVLTFFGLKQLNENPRPGLKALIEKSGVARALDVSSIVFTLGPRFNAAGRVAHANGAVELLLSNDLETAREHAGKVDISNLERRGLDLSITEEALSIISTDPTFEQKKSTVLFRETWHKGVIGIVASRVLDKHYRPTVILTLSDGKITGSARSVEGFDLYAALDQCKDLLEKFGGHRYAAGLTMPLENLALFRQRFEDAVARSITLEMLTPAITIDAVLSLDQISWSFYKVTEQMAPFGPQNLRPVFETRNLKSFGIPSLLKERHLKFKVQSNANQRLMDAICFDRPDLFELVSSGQPFNMVYTVEENTFNDVTSLQIRVRDIQPAIS
ncbi:MAG: single-stranded-DNA-specific exonuclease RecJ [Cyclobacteriaceae bacterium]